MRRAVEKSWPDGMWSRGARSAARSGNSTATSDTSLRGFLPMLLRYSLQGRNRRSDYSHLAVTCSTTQATRRQWPCHALCRPGCAPRVDMMIAAHSCTGNHATCLRGIDGGKGHHVPPSNYGWMAAKGVPTMHVQGDELAALDHNRPVH